MFENRTLTQLEFVLLFDYKWNSVVSQSIVIRSLYSIVIVSLSVAVCAADTSFSTRSIHDCMEIN